MHAIAHDDDPGLFGIAGLRLMQYGVDRCRHGIGRQGNTEALDVNALFGHTSGQQRGLGLVVHLERTADVHMVDATGWHHAGKEGADLVAVHHALVERRVGLLVGKHVLQHQPRHVAVLEVFEFFLEHRRLELPVAVDQRKAAQWLASQNGFHDRQDRRDATAPGDTDVVALRRRIERHEEASLGRHHLNAVARLQMGVDPVGENAAAHFAHADAQLAIVDSRADRIRAPQVLPVDVAAQREVLALRETEHLAQVGRHIEAHDDGFLRVGLDSTHAQRMKQDTHGDSD